MSDEHCFTPDEARARVLCPQKLAIPRNAHHRDDDQMVRGCEGDRCAVWRWAWANRDGFEIHEETQTHWSDMAGSSAEILAALLIPRLGEAAARPLAEAWAALHANAPVDLFEPADDDTAEFADFADRLDYARGSVFDNGEDETDEGKALLAWCDAVEDLGLKINSALNQAITDADIEVFARDNYPDGAGWGVVKTGKTHGRCFAKYQRPVLRRGYCGLGGRG